RFTFNEHLDHSNSTHISTAGQHHVGSNEAHHFRVLPDDGTTQLMLATDDVVVSVSQAVTFQLLPMTEAGQSGSLIGSEIVLKQAVTGTLTVLPAPGETIDGMPSIVLVDGQARWLIADGSSTNGNWIQVGRFDPDIVSTNSCLCEN